MLVAQMVVGENTNNGIVVTSETITEATNNTFQATFEQKETEAITGNNQNSQPKKSEPSNQEPKPKIAQTPTSETKPKIKNSEENKHPYYKGMAARDAEWQNMLNNKIDMKEYQNRVKSINKKYGTTF